MEVKERAKHVVKMQEMDADMLQYAVEKAHEGIEKSATENEIASYIKEEFDKKYGFTWHCAVGRNFTSYVTHEKNRYCYFYIGQMGVCLFKSP